MPDCLKVCSCCCIAAKITVKAVRHTWSESQKVALQVFTWLPNLEIKAHTYCKQVTYVDDIAIVRSVCTVVAHSASLWLYLLDNLDDIFII